MVIAVDVDGVLRDFITQLQIQYKIDHPDYEPVPVTAWGLDQFFPIGRKIWNYAFYERGKEIFENAPAYFGALEFIHNLKKLNHTVIICTTQPIYNEEYTAAWLRKNGFEYDGIFFTKYKGLLKADILLDDAVHNLCEFAEEGGDAVCMDRPWNQEWDGPRVKTYDEFLRMIDVKASGDATEGQRGEVRI